MRKTMHAGDMPIASRGRIINPSGYSGILVRTGEKNFVLINNGGETLNYIPDLEVELIEKT